MRILALGLIITGLILPFAGGMLWLAWRLGLPLGRLPGVLHFKGKRWAVVIPIVTCLLLSLLVTVLLNLYWRR
jgi:hypothetical protein